MVADLRKLAMLAVPLGMRVAYEALSWGRHAHQLAQAWSIVERANHANLGLCVDSFHALANEGAVDTLDVVDPAKVFLVQLSDFLWQQIRSREERIETARHLRVFPGEGVHNDLVAELVRRLQRRGLRGRLQLRGLQRRLRPDAAGLGVRARHALGALDRRPGGATQPSGAARGPRRTA